VWQPCELLHTCYLLVTYSLTCWQYLGGHGDETDHQVADGEVEEIWTLQGVWTSGWAPRRYLDPKGSLDQDEDLDPRRNSDPKTGLNFWVGSEDTGCR